MGCTLPRCISRSLWVGAFAAAGLSLGWVPEVDVVQGESAIGLGLSFSSAVYAQQSVSDTEVRSYAQTVLEMEPYRMSAYDEIKRITGAEVPPILCHRSSSLSNLDPSIRDIATNFCQQAVSIAESHNLSIARFNEITVAQQSDSDLADRIRQVIREIQ